MELLDFFFFFFFGGGGGLSRQHRDSVSPFDACSQKAEASMVPNGLPRCSGRIGGESTAMLSESGHPKAAQALTLGLCASPFPWPRRHL